MKTLLTAIIIAMSASLALAECAWVLWNQHAGSSSLLGSYGSWTIEGGYKTAADCATGQARSWDATMKRVNTRDPGTGAGMGIAQAKGDRPNSISVELKDGGSYSHRFLCLPDTIDPREDKGSRPGARRGS
jgi:hypothetical protein